MLKTKTPRALGLVRSSLNSPKGIHGKHAANVLRGETSDVFSLQWPIMLSGVKSN